MKANELRIGNYVDSLSRKGGVYLPNNYPLKLITIGFNEVSAVGINENPAELHTWPEILLMNLTPLPLTKEWLEKLGFKTRHDEWAETWIDLGWLYLGNGVLGTSVTLFTKAGISTGVHVKHVHQLQNLYFALTGTELEFKER